MEFFVLLLVVLLLLVVFGRMFSASGKKQKPLRKRGSYEESFLDYDDGEDDDWETGRGLLYWGMVRTFEELEEAVVLDVETTGLDPKKDRIVALAMMKIDFTALTEKGYYEQDMFYEKFNPGVRIPIEASRIHGIRNRDVSGASSFSERAQEIRDFVDDLPLVAHNASFDKAFLSEEFKRAGVRPGQRKSYCTMRRFMGTEYQRGNMKGATLDNTARLLGLGNRGRRHHDALEDVRLTVKIAAFFARADRENA